MTEYSHVCLLFIGSSSEIVPVYTSTMYDKQPIFIDVASPSLTKFVMYDGQSFYGTLNYVPSKDSKGLFNALRSLFEDLNNFLALTGYKVYNVCEELTILTDIKDPSSLYILINLTHALSLISYYNNIKKINLHVVDLDNNVLYINNLKDSDVIDLNIIKSIMKHVFSKLNEFNYSEKVNIIPYSLLMYEVLNDVIETGDIKPFYIMGNRKYVVEGKDLRVAEEIDIDIMFENIDESLANITPERVWKYFVKHEKSDEFINKIKSTIGKREEDEEEKKKFYEMFM